MRFNVLKLGDALKKFSIILRFWGSKMSNSFFKQISVLSVVQSPWESQNLLTQVTMLLDIFFSFILLHFSVNGKKIE